MISTILDHPLLRRGVGSIGVKLAGTILSFVLAVVLARALGPASYGVYAFVLALVNLIAIPALLGLPQLVIRETARAQVETSWESMLGLWRWSTRAVLGFSGFIVVVIAVILHLGGNSFSGPRRDVLVIGLCLIPLIGLGSLRGAALRGLRRVVMGQLPEFVVRPGILLFLTVIALTASNSSEFSPVDAMILNVVSAAVAFAVGVCLLRRAQPPQLKSGIQPVYRHAFWLKAALPLALVSGLQVFNKHIDIMMLGMLRSDAEVGIYRVVVQGSTLVVFGLSAVNMVVAPYFARYYNQREHERLQRLVTQSARMILGLSVPVALIFIVFGSAILGMVFGEAFRAGYLALAIISGGQIINAGMGSVALLLNMTGHERDTMRGVALAAVGNVVLNVILIPPFGIEGAAIATAVTLVIWNVALRRAALIKLGIETTALGKRPFLH